MSERRRDPESLLRSLKEQTGWSSRGRLKIFFGYAAGVGKTYAMLEAARQVKAQGVDVVIGYIEPHARPQTMALTEGLVSLPVQTVTYKGLSLKELDLDQALKRRPQLILVDELAHTNAPGSRHLKRYQDVEELLKAGIDVYSTVNVQHLESLNDIVASITGIAVRERIPDSVFDEADQVELVDLEPQELIQRLNQGLVYRQGQAQKALSSFFTVENLTALREIALRRTADRVMRITEKVRPQASDYYTDEHILVCLSAAPTNGRIIRTAARLAQAFKGRFTALFVETPAFGSMTDADRRRLRDHIHLAQQLGAQIELLWGEDIPAQIAEFARLAGVSKIVLGRSNTRRPGWGWGKESFSEKLSALAPNLDIYIIPDKQNQSDRPYTPPKKYIPAIEIRLKDLGITLVTLAICTLLSLGFRQIGFSEANIITVYILGVQIVAIVTQGQGCSLIASLAAVLTFNFVFTEPRFTLAAYDEGYPVTFVIMFAAGLLTSSLAGKIKRHAAQSAQTAYRMKVLLETSQQLQQQTTPQGLIDVMAKQLLKMLNKPLVIYDSEERRGQRQLTPPCVYNTEASVPESELINPNEQAVADWVFRNNKRAGASTATLGSARCYYLAIRAADTVYGVVGIALNGEPLDPFENNLVLSMLSEGALALDKETLARRKEEAQMQVKNEQLRANLLRSISHDLRTPLTSISGNAGILLNSPQSLDSARSRQLIADIAEDSAWLINLVENLLSITKIENGTMSLNLQTELMEEVITEALQHISRHRREHHIVHEECPQIVLVRIDSQLMMQVIINLVNNAIQYTPEGSRITIRSFLEGQELVVEVADDGPGIPDAMKERIFDLFYTSRGQIADSRRGMGLGLALCQSIISAHGGRLAVRDNVPHGALFSFRCPAEEVCAYESTVDFNRGRR